ncbi:hypothetical protein D3C71_1335170 [compost metagenome]
MNPGLIGSVSFVKPDNTNDNYNKTKSVFEASEKHEYRYIISDSAEPVIVGLPFNTGKNGDIWKGASLLASASLIPIEDNNRTITIIDYDIDSKVIYGYQNFQISEAQILRESPLLSKPIIFTEITSGSWKASFDSPSNGQSYYYQVGQAPVQVNLGQEYLENSKSWIGLPNDWTIQAMTNSYVTVVEVVPVEEGTSHKIIAYQTFKLTSTTPNTPTD